MSKHLLLKPNFLAYFSTQFMGALNDNVYKNGLVLSILYNINSQHNEDSLLLINIAAAVFILPFIFFSPIAGQLSQNSEKSRYIQKIKLVEIVIMLMAAILLLLNNIYGLIFILFLMGVQSTFFGPVKYSILPLMLDKSQLYQANGLVEAGTFIAILCGLFISVFIMSLPNAELYLSACIVAFAFVGYFSARNISSIKESKQSMTPINFNIALEFKTQIKTIKNQPALFYIMFSISWFWFIGATYLTQLPAYVKIHLSAEPSVFSLLLSLFALGIGLGSINSRLLVRRLSLITISHIGLIGLIIFGILFSIVPTSANESILTLNEWLQQSNTFTLMLIISLLGVSGGTYIVPLYTLLQYQTHHQNRSRMVASNNVLNAILMVFSAILAILLLSNGFLITDLFFIISCLSIAVLFILKNKLSTHLVE